MTTAIIHTVTTVAALTAVPKASLVDGDQIQVAGYSTAGDKEVVTYVWDADSTATANGGTVLAHDDGDDGRFHLVKDVVNVREFGAVGDWNGSTGTDNSDAFDAALASGNIFVPPGDYLVSRAIVIPDGRSITAAGRGQVIIRRASNDTATETISDGGSFTNRNTLIFVKSGGHGVTLSGMTLRGNSDAADGTTLIETGTNVRFLKIDDVLCTSGRYPLLTSGELWMFRCSQLRMLSCANGLDASNSGFKTSWNVSNAYAENCGTGYVVKNLYHSEFSACGADHVARPLVNPYDAGDTNPYGIAFGDPAMAAGVYNFSGCTGVTLNGCGSENCWGNGFIRNQSSKLVINGFKGYNLKSSYSPNYGSYPNFGVGPFSLDTEAGTMTIASPHVDGYVQYVATSTKVYFVAINYLEPTYGEKTYKMVYLSGANSSGFTNGTFGGQISTLWPKYAVDHGKNDFEQQYGQYLSSSPIRRESKVLTGPGTRITIPVTSQGSSWQPCYIKIRILGYNYSVAANFAGGVEFGVRCLTSLSVQSSPTIMGCVASVSVSSMNIIIDLTGSLDNIIYDLETMGSGQGLLLLGSMTLTTP